MPWTDRLKEAAYTSPSGERYTFDFENVSNSRSKKTTPFEFPDADGTYVQESGSTGRTYPLRCIFWGADYDTAADAFDAALFESGTGKLEHPLYGTVDVVPTGAITRRDDLKTAANQAIVDVTFMATIGLVYPSAQDDPASQVLSAVTAVNTAISEEFEANISLDSEVERVTLENAVLAGTASAKAGLQGIADTVATVAKAFEDVNDSINTGIDVLVGQPLTLAVQVMQLIQIPALASALISDKLDAYQNLAESLTTNADGDTSLSSDSLNFYTEDLLVSGHITGMILSNVNNQFETRVGAVTAAAFVLDQFEDASDWKDANLGALGLIDTGAAYQQLQKAAALVAGYLVEISFTLKQERRVVLDRARTIVDLAAEFYGEIDDRLDFLIESNELTGSEILELPRGREVVYYV